MRCRCARSRARRRDCSARAATYTSVSRKRNRSRSRKRRNATALRDGRLVVNVKTLKSLGKDTIDEWSNDNVARLSASLAFYTMMSLAPLVLVVVGIAGLAFGQQAARGEIVHQIQGLVGKQGA